MDPIALLTANQLDIWGELEAIGKPMAIVQSTMKEFAEKFQYYELNLDKGLFSVGVHGGRLVRSEISPEQVYRMHAQLKRLIDWVNAKCVIVPAKAAEDLTRKRKQHLCDLVGVPSLDSVLAAAGMNYLLCSDDERLRSFAKGQFGIDGVWTQPLLLYLLRHGKVTEESYAVRVVDLISLNYRFTAVSDVALYMAATRSELMPLGLFEMVAKTLRGDQSDLSAISVATKFFKKLMLSTANEIQKANLIAFILSMLIRERRTEDVFRILTACVKKEFLLIPQQQLDLTRLIRAWYATQLLM